MSQKSNSHLSPVRHISVRVPWHDSGWTGCVCRHPSVNSSCLALPRVRELRKDATEEAVASKPLDRLPQSQFPACIAEHGTFMAPFEITRTVSHPYSDKSDRYAHLLPTELRLPPYSAAAIPFKWMNRKYAPEIADRFGLDFDPEREPDDEEWLEHNKWVLDYDNQLAQLEGFSRGITPEKSLCFFYAKQTPLADDDRRVIIGVGRVVGLAKPREYDRQGGKSPRSCLWELTMRHSIRPDFQDGFIMPYQQVLEKCASQPALDPSDYVAFAPDDRRDEFSYGSEHVTNDAAIAGLLACRDAILKCREIVDGPWDRVLSWISERLGDLWRLRGPYPGLGPSLTALGIEHGTLLAYELSSSLKDNQDPWPLVDRVFQDPSTLSAPMKAQITSAFSKVWTLSKVKKPERLAFLKLIARMEVTEAQAKALFLREKRCREMSRVSDEDLLANPYLFYELTRFSDDPVSVWTVDRGLFPDPAVRKSFPLPTPSALEGPMDPRRVRALMVACLEDAAARGHTLQSRDEAVRHINSLPLDPPCQINGDLIEVMEKDFPPEVTPCSMKDGTPGYQLQRLADVREAITDFVERRIKGKRHELVVDWRGLLDKVLGADGSLDESETKAREEKAAALAELAASRFSVLVGPAGTGKTTLLSVLCNEPTIKMGGVLLLAPTGKARVRMQVATGINAQTIAQFLLPIDRYDEVAGIYRLSEREPVNGGRTVVVDEASMLTEEQLGALINSLKGVDRLILVGDPHQLPPIGSGRPFLDIVNHLKPAGISPAFPRVSQGYAELTVVRRQSEVGRDLAAWFAGGPLEPGEDQVFADVLQHQGADTTRFVQWNAPEDLYESLLRVLTEQLKLKGPSDHIGFGKALGGNEYEGQVYFRAGAAEKAEAWQILSPVRGMPFGVRALNRFIQSTFRSGTLEWAKKGRPRRVPKPMGPEEIVYGDKVINVVNWRPSHVYPKAGALRYVANGEIGVVEGQFIGKDSEWKGPPKYLNVEFSSQPSYQYRYEAGDLGDEGTPLLELAYAITVHKAQGSEFGLVILVIPEPCRNISRELLYTALTRHKTKTIILYQGELAGLLRYASDYYSDAAARLTNLFALPNPVAVNDRFLEEHLIHRSGKGVPMRSKSEVIIADSLSEAGLPAEYEMPLKGNDGSTRYPDFTIDDGSGRVYYWEHCGLMGDRQYRERWERKLQWYAENGILPLEQGGGPNGVLVVTQDTPSGGIDSGAIKDLIRRIWG